MIKKIKKKVFLSLLVQVTHACKISNKVTQCNSTSLSACKIKIKKNPEKEEEEGKCGITSLSYSYVCINAGAII